MPFVLFWTLQYLCSIDISTRNRKETVSLSLLSRKCRILNISQPYKPPRPVKGLALPFNM
jgi:hypothetical protein